MGVFTEAQCVSGHTAYIMDRGGMKRVGQLQDMSQVQWGRVRDTVSEASLVIQGDACAAQSDFLKSIEPHRSELCLYRGTERVWEGPVSLVGWHRDYVEIGAKDVFEYLNFRPLQQAYDNSYPNDTLATTRVANILAYELTHPFTFTDGAGVAQSLPGWEQLDPPANIQPFLQILHFAGEAGTSAVTTKGSMTVGQHIDNLARTGGIDYTVVGRAIIVWDVSNPLSQTRTMTEADFFGSPIVTAYGADHAVAALALGASGAFGAAGANDAYYGPWAKIFTTYDETDTNIPTQSQLNSQADRNMSGRNPVPVEVRIPDNSSIRLSDGFALQDLIPGVYVPVRATLNARQLVQMQKVQQVTVRETGADGETVQLTLVPATAPDEED
jgi:hypothetical protein